jgi:hypothetical protein
MPVKPSTRRSITVHVHLILGTRNALFVVMYDTRGINKIGHGWVIGILSKVKREEVLVKAHCQALVDERVGEV